MIYSAYKYGNVSGDPIILFNGLVANGADEVRSAYVKTTGEPAESWTWNKGLLILNEPAPAFITKNGRKYDPTAWKKYIRYVLWERYPALIVGLTVLLGLMAYKQWK